MDFEIIDFHTHPFLVPAQNICSHAEFCAMSAESTPELFAKLGVSAICGSVISSNNTPFTSIWDKIRWNNDTALVLKERYGDFYIPGFHIHPSFIDESLAEIHAMQQKGIRLIGELVPYCDAWKENYAGEGLSVLLDEAGRCNMVVSFHTQGEDDIDAMVKQHRDVRFVAAHPGEYATLMKHIERMKTYDNYYLDLSGTGLFRYGVLRRLIDEVGVDRIVFGSDYPTCNTAMFIGGVLLDPLITDGEKEKIFSLNAKQLLFS